MNARTTRWLVLLAQSSAGLCMGMAAAQLHVRRFNEGYAIVELVSSIICFATLMVLMCTSFQGHYYDRVGGAVASSV